MGPWWSELACSCSLCPCAVCTICAVNPSTEPGPGTMREKDECGPNIGLVRLLIYLCQADFNTGSTDLSRPSVLPKPRCRECQYWTFEPKTIIFMRMHHRERDPNDIYNVSCEAMEHEKRRKLFIGKTQIALLLPPPRRVERRGDRSDNFGHNSGFPPVTGFTSLAWTLGQNTVGRRGPGKVHFNILMIMVR